MGPDNRKISRWLLAAACVVIFIQIGGCSPVEEDGSTAEYPVRMAAEWEPAIGSVIAWPLIIPESLVVELARDDLLYVMVSDEITRFAAEATLDEWGTQMDNVHFVVTEMGLAWGWPRDWGPFAVYTEDGGYSLADPSFITYPFAQAGCELPIRPDRFSPQRYRGDDLATAALADSLGFETFQIGAAVTGGNFLVDGHGTAFSTCIILMENRALGGTDEDYSRLLKEKLGIHQHVILPNYERAGIQHIDCAIKILDEETILVMRLPEDHHEYALIEEIADQLSSLTNVYGRPYRIIRIDSGRFSEERVAAYTNSLILNKKVLVPVFGIPEDEGALQTWRDAMPGYEIIGFENDIPVPVMGYTGWQGFDALHCRVRAIRDPGMLRIAHRRMDATVESKASWPIEVTIQDYSGEGLVAEQLHLNVRTQGDDSWREFALTPGGDEHVFEASIPGFASGTTVEYYVSASDNTGRHESLPRTAPVGLYSFLVE